MAGVEFKDFQRIVAGALGVKRKAPGRGDVPGAPGGSMMGSLQGRFAKWNMEKALTDGYEINEWTHACVNAVAHHASSVPWRVSQFTDEGQKSRFYWELKGIPAGERSDFTKDAHKKKFAGRWGGERKAALRIQPEGPLEQLLEAPNPYTTRQEMIERFSQHMLLGGNGILVKLRGKVEGVPGYSTPVELYPLFPQAVEIERDGQVPKKYVYTTQENGRPKPQEYSPENVIHTRLAAPNDPLWGMSPLMAAAKAVDTDVETAKWNLGAVQNRAIPDMLIGFEDNLDARQYQEAKRRVSDQHRTPGPNSSHGKARAPWVLGNKARIQQLSLSPVEMDYIRSRGMNRQSICSVFKVFPAVIMVMEGVTLANMETVLRHHWIETVIPHLERLQGTFNLQLSPDFGSSANGTVCWYDTSNVNALSENLMDRMRTQKIVHTEGIPFRVLNDRFELGFDLDGVAGVDEGFLPAGVVTVSQALAGENPQGGDSGGNPNTNPEGGEVYEPGDGGDINDPDPADGVPADPGDGNPDTELGVSPGTSLGAANDAVFHSLTNGDSDPHYGVERWTAQEALVFLESRAPERPDPDAMLQGDDHFIFQGLKLPTSLATEWANRSGVEVEPENVLMQLYQVKFYHGRRVEERREALLRRVRSWGFSV